MEEVGIYQVIARQAVDLLKKHLCYYSYFLSELGSSSLGRLPGAGTVALKAEEPGIYLPLLQRVR